MIEEPLLCKIQNHKTLTIIKQLRKANKLQNDYEYPKT